MLKKKNLWVITGMIWLQDSLLRKGLFVSQGGWGEGKRKRTREDDGKCNRSGSLFGGERLHDLSDTGQALWPLSYQKTFFELYNIPKELKASEWLKSARISLAEWLARPDVRLPRRVMVSVSTLMHGDSERINSTSPRNDLLCITFSRLIAT